MPRRGWPSGVTPSAASRRTAAGMMPSPQALSTGPARGFATVAARPPGPPRGGGHEALAAGLVHGARARLGDRDRQARERAVDSRGEAHRAAADDKHVDHVAAGLVACGVAAAASARVSHRMRTVSSAALSTVNAHAVIQADPVSGSAARSTLTA